MNWTVKSVSPTAKEAVKLIATLRQEINTFVELSGVIGGEERRQTMRALLGNGPCTHAFAQSEFNRIGERFLWEITGDNAAVICDDLRGALAKCVLHRPVHDKRLTPEQKAEQDAKVAARRRAEEDLAEQREMAIQAILTKKPLSAKAAIVAEYVQDQSDSGTDYFGHRVVRRVVIGWRRGTRESFRQMRRAACLFAETKHLGTADASIEHREKYAGGNGYYLSATGRHGTGWKVRAMTISQARHGPPLEDGLAAFEADVTAYDESDSVTITANEQHAGVEIRFPTRPPTEVLNMLKSQGWRWSRMSACWYKRDRGGAMEEAERLVASLTPSTADEEEEEPVAV